MSSNQAQWAKANQPEVEVSSLYRTIEGVFEHHQHLGNKTLFVFINAWAELSFFGVPPKKYSWTEHDRIVNLRGGGYAIMAFDLRRPFDYQFPAHRYGYFSDDSREGLQYFAIKPLICIPDRNGTRIDQVEKDRAVHKLLYGTDLSVAWDHPEPETLPDKKYIDFRPRGHLTLVKS